MVCPLSGSTDLEPSPEASPIAHAPFGGDMQSGRRQISKFENFASALNPCSGIALIETSAPNLAGFMAVGSDNGHLSEPFLPAVASFCKLPFCSLQENGRTDGKSASR